MVSVTSKSFAALRSSLVVSELNRAISLFMLSSGANAWASISNAMSDESISMPSSR